MCLFVFYFILFIFLDSACFDCPLAALWSHAASPFPTTWGRHCPPHWPHQKKKHWTSVSGSAVSFTGRPNVVTALQIRAQFAPVGLRPARPLRVSVQTEQLRGFERGDGAAQPRGEVRTWRGQPVCQGEFWSSIITTVRSIIMCLQSVYTADPEVYTRTNLVVGRPSFSRQDQNPEGFFSPSDGGRTAARPAEICTSVLV